MRRLPFLLLLLAAPLALAQLAPDTRAPEASGADDAYHDAAQAYVGGDTETAVQRAEAGLAQDPDHKRLQDLLDLLRQDQPPQDGDGEQDDQADSGDEGEEDSSEGENQPDDSDQGPEGEDETERDGTQQDQPEPQDAESRQRPQQPMPSEGSRMSEAEAQRLLDAVGSDEELLMSKMRRPNRTRRPERDW